MAKPLRDPPPSSSVARLLDLSAAARAVAPPPAPGTVEPTPEEMTIPLPAQIPQTGEPATLKREFVLTPSADRVVDSMVETLRKATGTRLGASHVMRATLLALQNARVQLEAEARTIGPMKLPSNARGREAERERFERRLALAISAALRAAAAMER